MRKNAIRAAWTAGIKADTFDPFLIAEQLDVEYKYVDLGNMDGMYAPILNEPLILLNDKLESFNKKYVVMAHEVGHVVMHPDLASYYTLNDYTRSKVETEANIFACTLLLNFYQEVYDGYPESFEQLKILYGMPEQYRGYILD